MTRTIRHRLLTGAAVLLPIFWTLLETALRLK